MFASSERSVTAALTVRVREAAGKAVPNESVEASDLPVAAELGELARAVRELLPWRDRGDDPVQMDVLESGYLEVPSEFAPEGWPYVLIGVASWDAADAVHASLAHFSLLSDAAWVIDWSATGGAFRSIRVPLDVAALDNLI